MGLKSNGIPCNRSITFTSISSQGVNKWALAGEAGLKGMIVKVDDTFYFSIGGSALTGCHQDGLNGEFIKEGTSLTAEDALEQMAADEKALLRRTRRSMPEAARGLTWIRTINQGESCLAGPRARSPSSHLSRWNGLGRRWFESLGRSPKPTSDALTVEASKH
jgi:hypothetical protein